MVTHLPKRKPEHRFILRMMLLSVFWIILYIALHAVIDSDSEFAQVDLDNSYLLTPQGKFTVLNSSSLQWVLGKSSTEKSLKRFESRTKEINSVITRLKDNSSQLRQNFDSFNTYNSSASDTPTSIITTALSTLDCDGCNIWQDTYVKIKASHHEYKNFQNFHQINSIISRILDDLARLVQLNNEQILEAKSLKPNTATTFFWSSPAGSSFEVVFFAIFGVLTNLLMNSAEYLSKNDFKPSQRWIAYTKLIYGPILAWILVTAIAVGWLNLGQYEVGTYSLPLVGFLTGLYSRKVVSVLNKLGKKTFGTSEKSTVIDLQEQFLNKVSPLDRVTIKPKTSSINNIKGSAFIMADKIIKTIVSKQEAQK